MRCLQLVACVGLLVSAFSLHASELKPDERVVLYPALAARTAAGWEVDLHGIVFEPERRRLLTAALRKSFDIDEQRLTSTEVAIFNERCRYFLVDNERGKKFTTMLGGQPLAFGTSAANGHFYSRYVWLTNRWTSLLAPTNGVSTTTISFPGAKSRVAPLEIHFLEEQGVSVISDIDDTIKISEVLDKSALLENTFCRTFKPVEGMAGVYRGWERSLGAQFHYVTASPWQLYVPLSDFTRSNGFPTGTWHMKEFRVKDRSVFELFASPERYKPGMIEPLLRKFPKRQFVLVGDSGEKDPEIYGALARKHPDQIRRIFIRDVTGESAASPRYEKAFVRIPRENWQLFKDPAQISNSLPASATIPKAK
jgi:phosphatidate phosphatase APP1